MLVEGGRWMFKLQESLFHVLPELFDRVMSTKPLAIPMEHSCPEKDVSQKKRRKESKLPGHVRLKDEGSSEDANYLDEKRVV